jgi:hypothetical protein
VIEVTVRCGCSRPMQPDTFAGPGRYRCSCGARVALSGLPKLDDRHCALPKGTRICNGPKLPDAMACEPCSVRIATDVLTDPEVARQLGRQQGATDYGLARIAETERMLAQRAELTRVDRRPDVPKACVVYYCELRPGIVKIGTTMHLATRMGTLHIPPGAVLAAEPGHYELEKRRHRQFAGLRVAQREDFRIDDALRAHIDEVASQHGDPFALATRLRDDLQRLAQDPSSELPCANVVTPGQQTHT